VPLLGREPAGAATQAVGPRWLAFGSNPRRDMHISWMSGSASGTPVQPSAPQVRWGRTAHYGSTKAAARSIQIPVSVDDTGTTGPVLPDQNTYYSSVQLTGLEPGTTYHYSVTNDGTTWSADGHFTTAPKPAKKFRFTVYGDQGTVRGTLGAMTKMVAVHKPAFHLHCGDLAYATPGELQYPDDTGYVPATWDTYLRGLSKYGAAKVPWQIAVGAHEVEPLGHQGYDGFLTRFPQAYDHSSGTSVASSFQYGNVGVIQLDGNEVSAQETLITGYSNGLQTKWLKRKLAEFRAAGSGVDFIVVAANCCCYSTNRNHGSDGGLRDAWSPLFDKYHVDLVLSGHVHAYERTHPMHAGQRTRVVHSGGTVHPVTDGTTYITAGTGGQDLYPTWYGKSGGGDPGTGKPHIWRFSGGDSAAGRRGTGHASNHVDTVTNYSAYRSASYCLVTVDVTPAAKGKKTSMRIRALRPEQTARHITTIVGPTVIDSVTLVRTSKG
jgi:hypothetical protein